MVNSSRALMRRMRAIFRNKTIVWGGLYAVAVTAFVASATWAFDETEPAEAGLRGLIAIEAPDDLSLEAFEELGGNWTEWSATLGTIVQKLYEDESLDAAGQREVISTLKKKLGVMKKALADSRYQSIFDQLVSLHGRLVRRVAVAEAALDTLELDVDKVKAARQRAATKDVSKAVSELKAYLKTINNSDAWLAYVRADELDKLTAGDGSPTEEALTVLKSVQKKFDGRETLTIESQREFLGRIAFTALENSIDTYLSVADEKARTVDVAKLREQLASLFEALEEFEATNSRIASTDAQKALSAIRGLSLDRGDRMEGVLRTHYFNYNLRIVASEEFLSRIIAEKRVEKGQVRENVLGARVTGQQTTTASIGIDLKPSNTGARFLVVLKGVTRSETQGSTDQATIYTTGTHHFRAEKPITFDGENFVMQRATISVDANNQTTGASTNYDRSLFGGYARGVAMREARRRRSQSEAIAASRVEEKTLPRFNKEVDENFEKANEKLESKVRATLKENGLFPSAITFRTSETHLMVNSRLMEPEEFGGSGPDSTPAVTDNAPLLVHVHETLMNNAIDRMELAGKTMTDAQLKAELETSLSTLLDRDVKLKSSEDKSGKKENGGGLSAIVFDKSDPIRFRIEDGELLLIIRAGFKQPGKADIPAQEITVPVVFKIEGDSVLIERGTVKVRPVERPKNLQIQLARAAAIRRKLESTLPNRKIDRKYQFKREGKSEFAIVLEEVKALNGWLTLVYK